jgi:hypothetical protein
MAERKAVGTRMAADVVKAQRQRLADQHAQHAAPARKVPDHPMRRIVDTDREEPLQLMPLLIENAESCVLGVRELACCL